MPNKGLNKLSYSEEMFLRIYCSGKLEDIYRQFTDANNLDYNIVIDKNYHDLNGNRYKEDKSIRSEKGDLQALERKEVEEKIKHFINGVGVHFHIVQKVKNTSAEL